jgi:hypothetical protein
MMLEELQRRNYSEITTRKYLQVVTDFARYFGKSPDKLAYAIARPEGGHDPLSNAERHSPSTRPTPVSARARNDQLVVNSANGYQKEN